MKMTDDVPNPFLLCRCGHNETRHEKRVVGDGTFCLGSETVKEGSKIPMGCLCQGFSTVVISEVEYYRFADQSREVSKDGRHGMPILKMPSDEDVFDMILEDCKKLRKTKNEDYGNIWKEMNPISITDLIFIKVHRVKSLEKNGKLHHESAEDSFIDIINYSLMKLYDIRKRKLLADIENARL